MTGGIDTLGFLIGKLFSVEYGRDRKRTYYE